MAEYLSATLGIVGSVLAALAAWMANESSKRRARDFERREARYARLVGAIHGFYIGTNPEDALRLKADFIQEVNTSWLYCPPDVVRRAYSFLQSVHTDEKCPDEAKEQRLGELMVAIRRDLRKPRWWSGRDLQPDEFQLLSAT